MSSAVPSVIAVCIGRCVTSFASAIPTTVAFGSFEGLYDREALIWVFYTFTLAGYYGLVHRPIYSAYVTTYAGWRCVSYIFTIFSGISIIPSCFLHESRSAYLLELEINPVQERAGEKSLCTPRKYH